MSTRSPVSSPTTPRPRTAWIVAMTTGLAVALSGFGLLMRWANASYAKGFLLGGLIVIVLAGFARWRSTRRRDRAGTAARIGAGMTDERDQQVLTSTFAVVGMVAILATSLASAAAMVGVDAQGLLFTIPFMLIGTLLVAFVVTNRRS